MIIVDSCGWLEWFSDGDHADTFGEYLSKTDNLLVPVIVIYEVYKVLKREVGEEKALLAVAYMKRQQIVNLDDTLALAAADISLKDKLAMADAIILATSRVYECTIVTADSDLKNQPNVTYIPKT